MYKIKIKLICECIWTCSLLVLLPISCLIFLVFVVFVLSSLNVAIMSCLDLLKRDSTVKFKREQRFLPILWYRLFIM